MTMQKALHSRDDVDRLYVSRKEGGRGRNSIDASIQWLEDYVEKHERRLITIGASGVMVIVVGNEHSDMSSNPGRDW